MRSLYSIPTSRPADWRAALDGTAKWAASCTPGHPLLYWRERAEGLLAEAQLPENIPDLVEQVLVPVAYLCRLAHSLVNFAPTGAAYDNEVRQALNDAGSFVSFEHILHLASRIKHVGYDVEFVGPQKHKAPDLIVPAQRVAIEARARGLRAPRRTLRGDFEHAEAKFSAGFVGPDRKNWIGILAVDLGVCGTPSLPDVARHGPNLADLTLDLDRELAAARNVAGAVVSWVGGETQADGDTTLVGMVDCSGWRMRDAAAPPPCIADAFDSWEKQSPEVARRTAPDRAADLRR